MTWRATAAELRLEAELVDGWKIKARLDRVDRSGGAAAVVDYKTGEAADQLAVETGEDVQLTTYAAMLDSVQRAEFLLLGKDNNVKTGAYLEGDALTAMVEATMGRLKDMTSAIEGGAALPAWGDEQTCKYCEMDVVCRRQAWKES